MLTTITNNENFIIRINGYELAPGETLHIKELNTMPNVELINAPQNTGETHKATPKGALKFDNGKADLSLNPTVALEEMARAFMLGEKKYGRYNFYKGMESSRLVAAALRHLAAWNDGEDNDNESGHSHLGHALACIAMLLQQQKIGTLIDNRYKG